MPNQLNQINKDDDVYDRGEASLSIISVLVLANILLATLLINQVSKACKVYATLPQIGDQGV